MDSGYLAILLLVVGLALIVCEVFIPSAGLIAALATLCIAGSVASAWSAWASTSPTYFALYALAMLLLIPSAISGAFYMLPRTAFGRKVLLEAPDLDEVTPYQEEQRQLLRLVGHVGKTLTPLNPGGLVEVDGTRQHCESEGMLLEAGTPVEVVAVKGARIVVRPVEHPHEPPGVAEDKRVPSAGDSLDFDLPRG
jgi:membrane-bound ClpP family serine protease